MADAALIVRTVFAVAAPVGSNILAASRAARNAAQASAGSAAGAATQTGLDRIATGQDRSATGQDREQTGQDRTATGEDRVQTGHDRTAASEAAGAASASAAAALANRLLADADALATAADRVQTGSDRTAAAASATSAAAAVPTAADSNVGYRANNLAVWTATRGSVAYVRNAAGVLTPAPADTLPMAFDAALAPKGPAFAGARTNLTLNPRAEGATLGVIGSGGVLPTNWSEGAPLSAGTSQEVVAFGYLPDGQPYVDVRWSAVSTVSGITRLIPQTPAATFSAGEIVTYAMGYQLIAGSLAGFLNYQVRLVNLAGSSTVTVPAPSATLQRVPRRVTCTGNTSATGIQYLFTYGAGAIDATFRFVMPQLQRGPHLGSTPLPPIGTPGAFTEAQTSADIPVETLGTAWNYRQGLILIDWSSRPGPFTSSIDSDGMGLVSWGDRTANERMGLVLNPAHTSIEARLTAGGVVQAAASRAIAAPAADVITRAALAWDLDAGKLQVAARGAAGTVVTLSALPGPGWLMPGRFGPSHPGFVCIAGLEVRPAALFDAALAALT